MKLSWLWTAALGALASGTVLASVSITARDAMLQPHFGQWGFDLSGEDRAIRPGDDFNAFANGTYIAHLKIPADQTRYGPFNLLADQSEARVHAILAQAAAKTTQLEPRSLDGKIGAAYQAFMDEARVQRLGDEPIQSDLAQIHALRSRHELTLLMGKSTEGLQTSLFDIAIGVDDKNPTRYLIGISQDGLGLPDRDYYLTAQFATKKAAYADYVAKMLALIGWADPEASAKAVVQFETQIAQASWSRAQLRDPDAVYNPMTVSELAHWAPGLDWRTLLKGAQLCGESQVLIDAKSAFPKLAALYATAPLQTLKAWEAFHVADNSAPYLSKAFVDARFDFRGRTLTGTEIITPRWKRGVQATSRELGDAIGQRYVARYFPPQSKAQMEVLIGNLKTALSQRIEHLEWMSPQTKTEALKKLAQLDVQVGYPRKWRDYSALKIRADDLFGNLRRSLAFEWAYQRARLHKPVDKDEWDMTPQTVNAYNNPQFNEVVFPAAILQPPFFDPDGRSGRELRRHRRGHRPRDDPRLRRPGPQVRRRRPPARLVDRRGRRQALRGTGRQSSAPCTRTSTSFPALTSTAS